MGTFLSIVFTVIFVFILSVVFSGLRCKNSEELDFRFKWVEYQSVNTTSGKFKLEYEERRHLRDQIRDYNESSFYNHKKIFGEIVRLYVETLRELPQSHRLSDTTDFNLLFKTCVWFVLDRLGLYNENIHKPNEKDNIVQLIKLKSDSYPGFSENEKYRIYCMYPASRKARYDWLTKNYDYTKPETFYQNICLLNKYFPKNKFYFGTIEKTEAECRRNFFSAHQFLADKNRAYSLLLYLQYLNVKTTNSESFRYRTIPREIRPVLFKNKRMEERFTLICSNFKRDRNFEKAEAETRLLAGVTKRKIELDRQSIEEEKAELSQTAQILGKYLEEEEQTTPAENTAFSQPDTALDYENELIFLFKNNNFVLNQKEIDKFALDKGLFSDSMIQKINEKYFELFDDVLIEERENAYILNREYVKKL